MKVRIRHEDKARGRYFCDIEPTVEGVERLIGLLRSGNGLFVDNEEISDIEHQFCVDEDDAYCELVVS